MKLINADNFSNEFNSKIFNKLQNEYLNSTADDKTKDVADFVVTDIMTTFNDLIENAPTVEEVSVIEFKEPLPLVKAQKIVRTLSERPQGEIKKYKPLEPDYNVQCAVENLRAAYWSNEPKKVAKNFTEAEDIIISAICHHDYTICKQQQGEWVEGFHDHFETLDCSLCGYVRNERHLTLKFCPNCGARMRKGGAE